MFGSVKGASQPVRVYPGASFAEAPDAREMNSSDLVVRTPEDQGSIDFYVMSADSF